jgi:alcohol dehydrogenase (cytochrome c)
MMYIPANDNLCTELAGEPVKYVQGERYMGVAKNVLKMVAGSDHISELQAWDLDTGKKDGRPTAVVQLGSSACDRRRASVRGGTNDRMFRAFDAKTGRSMGIPDGLRSAAVPVSFRSTASNTSRFSPAGASTPPRCRPA